MAAQNQRQDVTRPNTDEIGLFIVVVFVVSSLALERLPLSHCSLSLLLVALADDEVFVVVPLPFSAIQFVCVCASTHTYTRLFALQRNIAYSSRYATAYISKILEL